MTARRIVTLLLSVLFVVGLVACGSDDNSNGSSGGNGDNGDSNSSEAAPVDVGNVNNMGSRDLGASMAATLQLEADDSYFKPTFIKAAPGAKVTVEIENEGSSSHTFTIDGTSVNEELDPGAKATAEVTVPTNGALQFHCNFHGSAGMVGAFYTNDGDTVTNAPGASDASDTNTTSAGSGIYGG
jgi:plastocyanin